MANIVQKIADQKLISPPKWLPENVHYCVIMGSEAYGVSSGDSDVDIYGYCMPPKGLMFPHLSGEISGFGKQIQKFDQWQEHHVMSADKKKEYDFTIYSIVKFFQLCMENNPNMLSALNVPQRCVMFASKSAQSVRDRRDIFLHKGSYHKFRGYAYAQLHKLDGNSNSKNEKRAADIEKFGFSTKFAYHIVRLALEAEQILTEHHLDVDRNAEILRSIRNGEWSLEKIRGWFDSKEKHLEELYHKSTLQHSPNEDTIKELLLNCIEDHYGSVSEKIITETSDRNALLEIKKILDKHNL